MRCVLCQKRRELSSEQHIQSFVNRYAWVDANWTETRVQVTVATQEICLDAAIAGKLHHDDVLDLFGYPRPLVPEADRGMQLLIARVLAEELPPKGTWANRVPVETPRERQDIYNASYSIARKELRSRYPEQYRGFIDIAKVMGFENSRVYSEAVAALVRVHKDEYRGLAKVERNRIRKERQEHGM
jgi:hypothetical protein